MIPDRDGSLRKQAPLMAESMAESSARARDVMASDVAMSQPTTPTQQRHTALSSARAVHPNSHQKKPLVLEYTKTLDSGSANFMKKKGKPYLGRI